MTSTFVFNDLCSFLRLENRKMRHFGLKKKRGQMCEQTLPAAVRALSERDRFYYVAIFVNNSGFWSF